jgi:sugar O-acyltransferase (sialic acid O-acetyltransferase NeuD family)
MTADSVFHQHTNVPARVEIAPPADFREFRKESILQGIHQRIEEQARIFPNRIAVQTQTTSHTYAELNGFANSVAAEILSPCGPGLAQAAILVPNMPDMLMGMLACLKARKAYVPLDPHFPLERLRTMLDDAEPAILLTDNQHIETAEVLVGNRVPILNLSRIVRHLDAPNPQLPCDPLARAYILYTSGSTGRPKGIAFQHRNLLHSTMCLTNRLFFAPGDRVSWLHSASFAASVVDIYCALTNGAALYPWDAKSQGFIRLAGWLTDQRVTTLQWIPSAFRQFLRTVPVDFVFPDVRMVVMASEPLTLREVELFRRHFPGASCLVNQVGTSESYNYRLYVLDQETPIESAPIPGGYAVSEDREVIILDEQRFPVPPGETGEIAVRSDYLSAGYWHDQAATQAKFVQIGEDPRPVYLTGDLGRLEPDGCLMHLGRKDSQVKIRGYRIELTEIERVLSAAPGVADSIATVAKNRTGEDQLVAYVVLKEPPAFHQQDIENYLASRLPDYMVPRHYQVVDSLPTLPTGKLNRNLNHVERQLAAIFQDTLQSEALGPNANFFQAGGDSLSAAVLVHRIHERFAIEVPIDEFLQSPTPRGMAGILAHSYAGQSTAGPSRAIKNLIIISAGKLGREAYTWASQAIAAGAPLRIKGFLDDRPEALNQDDYACIVGDVDTYSIEDDDVFIGAIGNPKDKLKYYRPIVERGGRFINLIHPLANVGHNVRLGTGVLVAPFASITCDVSVGNHVSVGAFSNLGHDTAIGDWCQVSSHCGINGNARLGDGAFLGSHACIIPGIKVGAWAYVGAGSVVVKDVAPGLRVFGNPALSIGRA